MPGVAATCTKVLYNGYWKLPCLIGPLGSCNGPMALIACAIICIRKIFYKTFHSCCSRIWYYCCCISSGLPVIMVWVIATICLANLLPTVLSCYPSFPLLAPSLLLLCQESTAHKSSFGGVSNGPLPSRVFALRRSKRLIISTRSRIN